MDENYKEYLSYLDKIYNGLSDSKTLEEVESLFSRNIFDTLSIVEPNKEMIQYYNHNFDFDLNNVQSSAITGLYQFSEDLLDSLKVCINLSETEKTRNLSEIHSIRRSLINSNLEDILFYSQNYCEEILLFVDEMCLVEYLTYSLLQEIELSLRQKVVKAIGQHLDNLLQSSRNEVNDFFLESYENTEDWNLEKCLDLLNVIEDINIQVTSHHNEISSDLGRILEDPIVANLFSIDNNIILQLDNLNQIFNQSSPSEELNNRFILEVNTLLLEFYNQIIDIIANSNFIKEFIASTNTFIQLNDTYDNLDELRLKLISLEQSSIGVLQRICTYISSYQSLINDLISTNFFVGKEAWNLRTQLIDSLFVSGGLKDIILPLTDELSDTVCSGEATELLVTNYDIIETGLEYISQTREIIESRLENMQVLKPAFDIPFVIEDRNKYPLGIQTFIYGANELLLLNTAVSRQYLSDSLEHNIKKKHICISFNVGVIPRNEFHISLTPDSIFGDWIKWVSGGFLLREKPEQEVILPKVKLDGLSNFLRLNVFRQWSGKVSLDNLIRDLNESINTSNSNIEQFFSKVE